MAVPGETPPPQLDTTLRSILAAGELAAVPENVLTILALRRNQANRIGPWVEGHYRDKPHP